MRGGARGWSLRDPSLCSDLSGVAALFSVDWARYGINWGCEALVPEAVALLEAKMKIWLLSPLLHPKETRN